jgi:hypothetical protein
VLILSGVRKSDGRPIGEGGRGLGDRAHVVDVVVTSAEERGARRRTQCRSVELVVAQAPFREAIIRRQVSYRSALMKPSRVTGARFTFIMNEE